MITLKEHNIKPYEELCRMLETQDKVAYVSATGTGKSYVIGKYIEEHGLIDNTVILVPSTAIKNSWKSLLPKVKVNTYQGLLSSKVNLTRYALIVCDEMHHLGAEIWGSVFLAGIENFSGKVIGLSATPIRYLDAQRDIVEECFDGNRVDGLDLPEAISKGVLPSFDYIAALYSIPKKIEKYRGRSDVTDSLFAKLDFDSSRYSFQEILKKHMDASNQKTVIFVGYVKNIGEIKTLCEQVFPDADHIEAYAEMGSSVVKNRIAQFENCSKRAFFYTVDLLNEGVHIDGVDSIIMFRKTESPAVYLQQLGRALSADNKQKRVKIFDFVANHGNLKSYKSLNTGLLEWISSGVAEPEKQVVISDYAMEELEVLDHIQNALSKNWTDEEDEIIRKYYDLGNGIDKVTEMLAPKRTRRAVCARATVLGITKKMKTYPKDMISDIIAFYPLENGIDSILHKYPQLSVDEIRSIANKHGARRRERRDHWTNEEETLLKKKADLPIAELLKLFPDRTKNSLMQKRKNMGLSPDKKHEFIWTKEADQILIDNNELSSEKIRDRFFPDVHFREINRRRYNDLKLPRYGFTWTPENTALFKQLYAEGGKKTVMNDSTFSSLTACQITSAAQRFGTKSPNVKKEFDFEELSMISAFMENNNGESLKELTMRLKGRRYETVGNFIRKVRRGEVDIAQRIEEMKVKEAAEEQNA